MAEGKENVIVAAVMEEMGDDSSRKCLCTNFKGIKYMHRCKHVLAKSFIYKTARCPCKAADRSCTPLCKCVNRKNGCQNKLRLSRLFDI